MDFALGRVLGVNVAKVCTDTGARTPVKLYRHNTDSWVLGSSSLNPMELMCMTIARLPRYEWLTGGGVVRFHAG